ncbi:MAG: hypothetical protein Q8O46_04895 [bacterium]|nr:hypothetical protein [bacterium]
MQNEEKSQIKNESCQNCCDANGKCTYRWHKKCWLWVVVAMVLLIIVFKVGWYSAMKYYGATWETPRSALMQ